MAPRHRQFLSILGQVSLLCLSILIAPPQPGAIERVYASELSAQIRKLASSKQPAAAANSLKRMGAPAIALLQSSVTNPKESLSFRQFAIAMLGKLEVKSAVPTLTTALNDEQREIRLAALKSLAEIGTPSKTAVPELTKALEDGDEAVRAGAIAAIAAIGPDAKDAVPSLARAFLDPNKTVRLRALKAISKLGAEAKPALSDLTQVLASEGQRDARLAAIIALGELRQHAKEVVPQLAQVLNDRDADIRTKTGMALISIGPDAVGAVPQLILSLKHPDRNTRSLSVRALGIIGPGAKDAVPELAKLLKAPENNMRRDTAVALGRIKLEARTALPNLMQALKDNDSTVRLQAGSAIRTIAKEIQGAGSDLPAAEIAMAYRTLKEVLSVLEQSDALPEVISDVRLAVIALQAEKDSRRFERGIEWIQQNPLPAGILIYLLAMPSLWLTVLLIRPIWLLKLNNALQPYTDFEIPSPLGGSIKVPLRFVLFVGWLHYHPRVLDAWIARQIEVAQEAFDHKSTVSDRKVYIPIPVVVDGNTVAELSSQNLHSTFWDGRQCLLIWGEGGIGKTSLACQLAKWAMVDDRGHRLARHRMLPVLIEQELDFKLPDGKDPFREAIRGQLQALVDAAEPVSDELLEKLLRQRRLLVIVDRLSELSEETRQQIRPGHPDFPANALIVTSRVEETLDEVPKTSIKPLRIEGNRLSSFLEAYLMQRGKRELFTDPEYFDACSQLSKMVGQRHITVLLAKLYAEQMIAKKDSSVEDNLPDNIPDLMLSYLNELNRDADENEPNNLIVHEDTKVIAWECLKQYYRPTPTKRETILAELQAQTGTTEEEAKARLRHLEKRLRIVQAIGPAEDQICFALDPLAECLAALYIVERYGNNKKQWEDWLALADAMPGAPESIQGFLLAVRDCCMTRDNEIDVPDTVMEELGRRVGLSPETLRKTQIEQRMRRLTPLLSTGDVEARIEAIRELGELGAPAKAVLSSLVREFHDRDWRIRREVAKAIGNIGTEARVAIPALIERFRDEDRRVCGEAIASLGKLGTASIPALITALEAEPAHIRSSAAWVLASYNSMARSAVSALTHALKDEDWQVRWVAAYALGCIGPEAKSAIPSLIEAFRGEYELVSKEASRTLWRISGEADAIVAALGEMSRGNDRN